MWVFVLHTCPAPTRPCVLMCLCVNVVIARESYSCKSVIMQTKTKTVQDILLTFFFFMEECESLPKEGNSGGVCSLKLPLLSHASHLTGKSLCKSVRWTQGEVDDWVYTVGWVSSNVSKHREKEGFFLSCSILPPEIPSCPCANKSFFFFFVMKLYPGDI